MSSYRLSSPVKKAKGEAQDGTLRQKPRKNAAYWLAPSIPRTPYLGRVPLTVGWALPIQLGIKKIYHRHAHRAICWRQSSPVETLGHVNLTAEGS